MTWFRLTAFFGGFVLVVLLGCQGATSGPGPATTPNARAIDTTPKPTEKGIDAATVAAYEKLGAIYGGYDSSHFFQAGRDQAENGMPIFRIHTFLKAKLPEVAVPFGID